MKKYLIILKGEHNIGKTTVLKLLIKKLIGSNIKIYEIDDCKYIQQDLAKIDKEKDMFCSFNTFRSKIIISTGGDYSKCIKTFLNKFKNEDVFIGVTACQCVNRNNQKYQQLKIFAENNKNVELIEIYTNKNSAYTPKGYKFFLNMIKVEELLNLINKLILLKKNNIYSMLSDEEKLNLFYLSKNLNLNQNSVIIEYGVFLGGSLQFIIEGLKENETFNTQQIYAIDNYFVDKSASWFEDFKKRFIDIGLNSCIKKDKIEWMDVVNNNFLHFNNLKLIKASHKEFKLNNTSQISLLHLDLAKRFKALKEIFINLHNNINSSTLIIHQDFFYLFSGEVVAFIYKMLKENKIDIYSFSSFGSIYLKNFNISLKDMENFDIKDIELLVKLIEESIKYFDKTINEWQKASLYGAIINLLKNEKLDYNFYLKKLNQLKNKKTESHIKRMLVQLQNNNILFKGYL